MVGIETWLRLVGGVALLLGNGFFVTTEFALTRVRQFDQAEFASGGLARAWEMTERLEIFLSGCQVGITICSVGLGVVAEPAVAAVFDPLLVDLGFAEPSAAGHTATSVILALALINLLHVVVGEQVPTYLGVERTKFVSRYGAPLLYWWTWVMSPVILLADRLAKGLLGLFGVDMTRSWAEEEAETEPSSRAELRREMGTALSSAGVSEERREEVINALEIGDRTVEEIMVPREDILALSTADDVETTLARIGESPHVRFPLVGDDLDDFVGIVYTPAVLRELDALRTGETTFADLAAPPMTVTADAVVSDLIDRFQSESQELALVLDDGEVVGLVTATDAFEEITGDLEDPLDGVSGA